MPATEPDVAPPAIPRGRRRGPRKGDQREAAILEVAWRLLGENPVSSITIDQLASGAGISRSAFYFYFESRDAVVRALAEDAVHQLRDIVAVFTETVGEPVERRLRSLVELYLQRWRENSRLLQAMFLRQTADPDLKALWDQVAHEIRAEVATAIEAERAAGRALPAPPSASDLANALSAMLWRAAYEAATADPWTDDTERLVDTLTIVCRRAIDGGGDPGKRRAGRAGP